MPGFNQLSEHQIKLLQKQINEKRRLLKQYMGMETIQKELSNTSADYEDQDEIYSKRLFFNRFASPLKYFNPNTSNNAYKSGIISPAINFIGQVLNFANDQDCAIVGELFSRNRENSVGSILASGRTWAAFGRILLSSLGAAIRLTATVTDFALDGVFSPIRTLKNLWSAVTHPKQFFSHINRHYQLTAGSTNPPANVETEGEISVKTLTLNVCMLRSLYWQFRQDKDQNGNLLPLNKLRPPKERIQDLIDDLLEKGRDRDVICLQEMFDNLEYLGLGKDAQALLIEGLKPLFPHVVYDIGHRSWPASDSGLIVFSKFPILEVDYCRYPNLRGLDTLTNKGFVGVKIQKGDKFFTVYNTHTQAGGGLPTEWMETLTRRKPVGGTGDIRNEQLGYLHEHMVAWATTAPASRPHLKHLDTLLMGDLNQGLNNANKIYGVSHGKKPAGALGPRVSGEVKYEGQSRLMHHLSPHLADNFIDCRSHQHGDKTDQDRTKKLTEYKSQLIGEIVNSLRLSGAFTELPEADLIELIRQQFTVYTGTIISDYALIQSVLNKEPGPVKDGQGNILENDCEHEKYVDACFSANFDKPKALRKSGLYAVSQNCLIFSPVGKQNHFYTDHAGICGDFTYSTTPPEAAQVMNR